MSDKRGMGRELFNKSLIKEVQKYQCLYDNSHADFRNKKKREDCWYEVGCAVGEAALICRNRWQDLRKQYAVQYSKMTTPGAVRNYYWRYTDAMSFLQSYVGKNTDSPNSITNFSKRDRFCRTCLCPIISDSGQKCSKVYSIFDSGDLAEKLTQCSNRQVVQWDEYPQSVCEKCYKKIVYFSEFQLMCQMSLDKFNTMVHDPNQVKFDLDQTIDCSLNSQIESTSLSSLLNEEDGIDNSSTLSKELKISSGISEDRVNFIESGEIVDDIMEEIIQVEIERSTEDSTNKKPCEENENISPFQNQAEELFEDGSDIEETTEHVNFEDLQLDDMQNEDDEDYIVDELAYTDALISHQTVVTGTVKAKHANKRQLKCDVCPKSFRFEHCLEAHRRRHQGLSGFPCPYENCSRSYDRLVEMRNHLNDHNGIRNAYQCDVYDCNKVYKCYSNLWQHKRADHNWVMVLKEEKKGPSPKKYMCEKCGKVVASRYLLKSHHFIHVDKSQWPYVCDEEGCHRRFRLRAQLAIHKNRHAGIKNYVCPICGVRKTTSTELKTHINYHTFERKYPCRICSKVFKSAGILNSHTRLAHVHGGHTSSANMFECRFCSRKLSSMLNLKQHERTHTGEKPYACQECGKTFAGPQNVASHMQMHLKGEKPHVCGECGKRFKWSSNLTTHKKLHLEGGSPYSCQECGQRFRWPGSVYFHKKKHMREKLENAAQGEEVQKNRTNIEA